MIKLWRFLSVAIVTLAVVLGLVLVPGLVSAGTDCWLEINPANTTVGFDEVFDVNVTMENPTAQDLNMIMCHINFTASLVEVTGVDVGAAVGSPFTLMMAGPTWDNAEGWVDIDYGCPTGTTTNATSVVYATIHMKSKAASGIATVEFVPGTVAEPETAIIDALADDHTNWALVVNGTVTVSGAPSLWVNVTPAGSGNITIKNTITPTSYPNTTEWTTGENVTLEAVPAAGWAFLNWTGVDGAATANPNYVIMNSDKNVTANFYGQEPTISPVPTNLTFSGNVGGNVTNQTLQIWNGGGGILNWTANITYSAVTGWTFGWLSMSPTSGTNLAAAQFNSTQVAVNTNGLTEGIYYANITINSTDTAENKTVPVTLNLGVPEISASPTTLTFTTNEGENPADKTLKVCNSGTGTLNWSLTDNAAWLSENPTSGSLAADKCKDVTVSVDASGLAAGDYSATITITGSPTKTIPVNLHIVSAMPELPVAPASLSASGLSISPHQVKPDQEVTISINVANSGGETGSYNAVLYINGAVEDSQSVSVAPGMTKNVIFTVSKSDAGVYDVLIAGQSGQFEVVHTGWFGGGLGTGGIVVIVVIVIAIILALFFVLRGTRRAV